MGLFTKERNKTKENDKKGWAIRKLDYKSGTYKTTDTRNWFPFFPFHH